MSEYIADSAALTHTADRIRAKTGGTDPITWDAAKGFGDAVDAIQAGGTERIEFDITITSEITNAREFRDLIRNNAGTMTRYVCYLKQYAGGAVINNQIVFLAEYESPCGIRFRNNMYLTIGGFGTEYDAAVTVGDVYTIVEL